MRLFDFFRTPFPRPRRNRKNLTWIISVGAGGSLFILLYQPLGIENQTGEWYIDLIILSLGVVFTLSILFMEWLIPSIFPQLFKRWTFGKALIWYSGVVLFVSAVMFLYKNFWSGFREFLWMDFFQVSGRIVLIGSTVSFLVLGIWQYFSRRSFSRLTNNETYTLTAPGGKSVTLVLKDILFIRSDDNYVDIHYLQNGSRRKAVFRSSLKNVEAQVVNPLSPIIRCHRQYLINTEYFQIEKMNSRSMTISLLDSEDLIPVSKKYIASIKRRLPTHP